MMSYPIFKLSVATSSKSGALVVKNVAESRLYYQTINIGNRGVILPPLPAHELILPVGGWLEDFILGDFGNPYVSSRAADLLQKEWGDNLEFLSLKETLAHDYFMLIVRPGLETINEKPCLIDAELNQSAFSDESVERLGVFRIAGREKSLFATSSFGQFIQRHSLTGVYLRDPHILLKDTEIPFGLPIMKHKKKPILKL